MPDSLQYMVSDSLRVTSAEISADTVCIKKIAAEDVYGAQSIVVPAKPLHTIQPVSLAEDPIFQSFVLVLAALYAILLYHNIGDIRQLFHRISFSKSSNKLLVEEQRWGGFSRFLNITIAIGVFSMGVMTVKFVDLFLPQEHIETLPHIAVLGLSLVVTLVFLTIGLFRDTVLKLIGAVTLSKSVTSQLIYLNRTYFALIIITILPLMLIFALYPNQSSNILIYIALSLLVLILLRYLRESLNIFISKKISLLHWFLYLCAVEIFPISLVVLVVIRYSA